MTSLAANPCQSTAAAATADALAAKFDEHQFVFIGSTHGDLKIEQFLACLVSRPAFKQRVTDIVTERRELDRRVAIQSDPQRTMRARFQGRAQWFRAHPNDFPARPVP